MIKAIVIGAAGRMGGRIINLIQEGEDFLLKEAIEHPNHPQLGKDIGEVIGLGKIGVILQDDLSKVIEQGEVIIDFTNAQASLKNLRLAVKYKKPMVIGSTGFSPEELLEVKELAKNIPCLLSPNMSVGVNLVFKIIGEIAEVLKDEYDVEIIEAHHRLKRDAPSGTALKMGQILAQALGREWDKVAVFQRKGIIGERNPKEIAIQTIRAGDIVGEHTVIFGGMGERLEITHRAHSRDNFARGALRAAKWIIQQKNGLYDMQDLLGLRERKEREG